MWMTRHKSLAMAIGIGTVAFLLIFVAVFPLFQNATTILAKIKSSSSELEDLTTKVSLISELDPNVLQERLMILDNALPPRKDVLLYLNSIDGLSKELGLTFGGLSLSPGELSGATPSAAAATAPAKKTTKVKAGTGLQRLKTEIKIRGGQENVYAFLRTIEEVLPLMEIENIKVAVLGDDQYSLTLTLAMLWAEPGGVDVKGAVTLFGAEEDKYFSQLSEYRRFNTVVSSDGPDTTNETGQEPKNLFTPFTITAPIIPENVPTTEAPVSSQTISGSGETVIPQQ